MSALDNLRARREELSRDRTLDLPVPGWPDGLLIARYGAPSAGGLDEIVGAARRLEASGQQDAELAAAADTLIELCRELLTTGEDGEPVGLAQLAGEDQPVRFDSRLADHLGFTAGSARECVYGVFPQDEHGRVLDFTVRSHAQRVIGWIGRIGREADTALAGEA